MHFDTTIRLGDVLVILTIFVTVLFSWRDMYWKQRNQKYTFDEHERLQVMWVAAHEAEAKVRDQLLAQLKENTILLRAIADETSRRVRMLLVAMLALQSLSRSRSHGLGETRFVLADCVPQQAVALFCIREEWIPNKLLKRDT